MIEEYEETWLELLKQLKPVEPGRSDYLHKYFAKHLAQTVKTAPSLPHPPIEVLIETLEQAIELIQQERRKGSAQRRNIAAYLQMYRAMNEITPAEAEPSMHDTSKD